MEIESKYQPLKEKLKDCENTIRRLNSEKRTVEMQLKHAESQLQEQKRLQRRESFWVSKYTITITITINYYH